jgi:two-component system NtrC family sensor kinase
LCDVATQVVLAFRNAVNMAELERRARRLTALARAQHQLTHVVGEDTLPHTIADAVRGVIPSSVCEIFTATRDGLVRVLSTRDGVPAPHRPASELELGLALETLASGTSRLAVHVNDTNCWARGTAELCAVVRFGNRSTGILRLVSPQPDAFDLQDLDLLTILARQAGTAVETSRLFTQSDFQRQRAEGAAELARVALEARSLGDGANELLHVLDRFVPSIGKAIGVARARDGQIEYVAASGTLDVLRGHRPGGAKGVLTIAPDGRPRELASLRDIAPTALASTMPDEWGFVVPLVARDRTLGVLVVSSPRKAPLLQRDRVTLERLSTSLALALDALLLDEEERLSREREHLLATALTTIDHPIFILDRVGVRYANPSAAREYGWSQVELMEMRFEQLVVTARGDRNAPIDMSQLGEAVSLTEQQHCRQDRSEFPATVTISPLVSQDGEQLGHVVSVRNVSADRRMAEQLRHTEKMVALGELVAGVAHEINNPLTGISAFAQILLEEELPDEQRESVQLIKQESDRAKAVIRDLLIFARKTEPVTEPFDLNELIEQTLRLRSYSLRVAGVRVVLHLGPTLPKVTGDPQKLQQVLLNVIANAESAMEGSDARELTLRTHLDGDRVVIAASDTGRGMPADVRQRIFEPFFTTKPEGVGTGLGMSVSYGIVQAHHGSIDVTSEPGAGTTVTIALPGAALTATKEPSVPLFADPSSYQ